MSEIDWSKAPHWADRVVKGPMTTFYYWANDEQRVVLDCKSDAPIQHNKVHIEINWEVVSRRPMIDRQNSTPRTIEQRIASLRALEKRVEETRAELTRDLEALGLTWTVRGEPTITDWRDLRVGDVVWIGKSTGTSKAPSGEYSIIELNFNDETQPVAIDWSGRKAWPDFTDREWLFIRRP